ncbi:MAG: SAM-dependent methyltransferase [Brachymonas sp.]|nr:SAM-dependent methyltransferase [Brachymonas sp.]
MNTRKTTIEFGDFQTPKLLAEQVCDCLLKIGVDPQCIIEPNCGQGQFLLAAAKAFPKSQLKGYEINPDYCAQASHALQSEGKNNCVEVQQADFFKTDWQLELPALQQESLLVLGNPPWVTNSVLATLESKNAPVKANFQAMKGMDAMTGAANFDISEWMLIQILSWFKARQGAIAMLVKSAVARKVLAHAFVQKLGPSRAWMAKIDAKQHFDVSVDACLLYIGFEAELKQVQSSYQVYPSLDLCDGQEVGFFQGAWVTNPQAILQHAHLLRAHKPLDEFKWRSGIKHDASAVCELKRQGDVLLNGLQEEVHIEPDYLYPLLKGSEVANGAVWSGKQLLVTQKSVGQSTELISVLAPKTWAYLMKHADVFDKRASSIYKNNPRFSIFGVGSYSFKPWRVAICALYKKLDFVVIAPIECKPVMFDDTVYYLAFDTEQQAKSAQKQLHQSSVQSLLNAMIFWDEKRPIKTSILNRIDLDFGQTQDLQTQLGFEIA